MASCSCHPTGLQDSSPLIDAGRTSRLARPLVPASLVGSLDLVQTLLREKLFDRLDLWVYPIVLGVGKKVFDGGAVPANLALLEPPVAGEKGTVFLRYGLVDGTPATGDMGAPDRGVGQGD